MRTFQKRTRGFHLITITAMWNQWSSQPVPQLQSCKFPNLSRSSQKHSQHLPRALILTAFKALVSQPRSKEGELASERKNQSHLQRDRASIKRHLFSKNFRTILLHYSIKCLIRIINMESYQQWPKLQRGKLRSRNCLEPTMCLWFKFSTGLRVSPVTQQSDCTISRCS